MEILAWVGLILGTIGAIQWANGSLWCAILRWIASGAAVALLIIWEMGVLE